MSTQTNHTPLDFNNLLNSYGKPKTTPVGGNKVGSRSSSNLPNLFLVLSVFAFVGAFAFSVTQQQATTNTQASAPKLATTPEEIATTLPTSPFKTINNYPTSFKGQQIPLSLFSEAEAKYEDTTNKDFVKKYAIDKVMRYYAYMDAMEEIGQSQGSVGNVTFAQIEEQLPELEKMVFKEAISSADVAVIRIWVAGSPSEAKAKQVYGDDLHAKAQEIAERYRTTMSETVPEDIQRLIEVTANEDQELIAMNNGEAQFYIENYTKNDEIMQTYYNYETNDPEFNNFLFSLIPHAPSEVYTYRSGDKELLFVLYPMRVQENKYATPKDLYDAKTPLFSF